MNDLLVLLVRQLARRKATDHGAGVIDEHIDAIEALAGSGDEILNAMTGSEIGGNEKSTTVGLGLQQEIRQFAIRIAADMDEDMGAAIEKLPRHF